MRQVWVGQHLYNLLNLSISELKVLYPDYTNSSLRGKKAYWNKQLREGKITMPPKPEKENTPTQGKLVKTWEVARGNQNDEWDIVTLHAYDHRTPLEEYDPIEPAKIKPTRAKRLQRLSRFILVYGDGQVDYRRIIDPITDEMKLVPLHNEAMHRIIQQFNAKFRPETTVNLGDFADMAALSRFDNDSDHFHKTLGPSLRYIHDFYAQLVTDNPDAHHVEVDSNHAVRPKKQVLKNIPALHDFVIPGDNYPLMTYYRLANLGRLGIDFISGYGNAEFLYGEDQGVPILFKHGTHSSSNPGATVRKEAAENPEVSVIRGHGHSHQEVRTTDRRGNQHFYIQLGSACINNGPVPGYHSSVDDHNQPTKYHNQKHQNTFSLIEDFGNGHYNVDILTVVNGKTFYRGEEYNGALPKED